MAMASAGGDVLAAAPAPASLANNGQATESGRVGNGALKGCSPEDEQGAQLSAAAHCPTACTSAVAAAAAAAAGGRALTTAQTQDLKSDETGIEQPNDSGTGKQDAKKAWNNRLRGFKFYGPSPSGGSRYSDKVERELVDPPRPAIPNRIAYLPVYLASDLLEILCAFLSRDEALIQNLYTLASLPKYIDVVQMTETLAITLQDVDQEESLLKGYDPIQYWLTIQEKLQDIALKRLVPKTLVAMQTVAPWGPKSFDEEDAEEIAKAKEEAEAAAAEAAAVEAVENAVAAERIEPITDEAELLTNPLKLKLIIPSDEPAPMY